jgi:8-oxo-dGTP pyrophosphatase MutT (NUDIX family)
MPLPVTVRRLAYRAGHRVLRVYWLLARPSLCGVKCILLDGDAVLLVRHAYGDRRWDLPGGRIRRGEPPAMTARREMREELGLELTDWTATGELRVRAHHRVDTIHCFTARVTTPALTLDLGELQRAEWFAIDRLPVDRASMVDDLIGLAPSDRSPA